jgi:hypothetical protein
VNCTIREEFLLRFLADDDKGAWGTNLRSRGSPVLFYEIKGLEEHFINKLVIYAVVESMMHLQLPGSGSRMVDRGQRSRGVDWEANRI